MYNPLLDPIQSRLQEIDRTIKTAESIIRSAPPGRLRCSRRGNKAAYFQVLESNSPDGIYLDKDNYKKAKALANKSYLLEVLEAAKKERRYLTGILDFYKSGRAEEVYIKLSDTRRQLVEPLVMAEEEYAKAWQEAPFVQKDNRDGNHRFYTAKGEAVCSKSEVIIANTLARFGVPYRYEQEIYLRGLGTVHSDFNCLNGRIRQEILWEHEGMMDDPGYAETAIRREAGYLENGYFPGINLIITRETGESPLDTRMIELIIRKYLL